MKSAKITPVDLHSGKQRMLHHTSSTLNAVILMSTIVFVVWIFGKIIAALHAFVFSLVFADTPEQSPQDFLMLEDSSTWVEVHSTLQSSKKPRDSEALYSIDSNNWSQ